MSMFDKINELIYTQNNKKRSENELKITQKSDRKGDHMANQLFLSGMGFENFIKLIDALYDEVLIYDNNYRIVYINNASVRHYGCEPWEMIGKYFFDFTNDFWWNNSVLPIVYQTKKAYAARQKTKNGSELLTIAIPVFDDDKELKYVVMNVRDKISETDLYYKDYNSDFIAPDTLDDDRAELCWTRRNVDLIKKTVDRNVNYLIIGEDGTGKKQLARYIHEKKNGENKPFLVMSTNASASEMEQELFGIVKNEGLDIQEEEGMLKACKEGTILIDEVSDLPVPLQRKLEEVLETGAFTPLNSQYNLPFKGTLIASTTRNLSDMIANGLFLEEFYDQLGVVELYIPSLGKRSDSLRPLIRHYLQVYTRKYGVSRQITEGAMEVLENYGWSGNLRELQNTVQRLVATTENISIDVEDLPKKIYNLSGNAPGTISGKKESFDSKIERYEAWLITEAYKKYGSSRKIAEHLDISQTRANNLLRKYVRKA